MQAQDKLLLGRVNGLFGVRGWLRIFSHTRPPENILTYDPLWLNTPDGWRSFRVEDRQAYADGRLVVKLAGMDDREVARVLMGCDIAIDASQLPAAAEGDYYWVQLIGCTVETLDGQVLGVVEDMMETGAHDVMRVKTRDGVELIPFAQDAVVRSVDLAARRIQVDWEVGYH